MPIEYFFAIMYNQFWYIKINHINLYQNRGETLIPDLITLGLTILASVISDLISDEIKNRYKRKH